MLVILSGVSGAGKDTIKKELIKRMEDIISLPSFTSREPRPGEEEGVQYHFISKDEFKGKIAYFAGIDKAKFRRKVVPGDTLRLEVELTKLRGRAGVGYGIAYVDDKKVCEGELTFMVG